MQSSSPDVVVVGAGIIGASIAWRLAQAKLRVALLDAGDMGGEASWAGAGMLSPGGEMKQRSFLSELAVESLRLYKGFVQELEAESGTSIDYRQCGAVEIAIDSDEWTQLLARSTAQQEFGVVSSQMSENELRATIPTLRTDVAGALWYPEDALVNPRDVIGALRVALTDRGSEIVEQSRVLRLDTGRRSVEVHTENDRLSAHAAVLSAGAWSSRIEVRRDGVTLEIPESFPVKGHLIGYQLRPRSLEVIVRHARTYSLQRENGFTIAGSSEEEVGFDRRLDAGISDDIAHWAQDLLPGLLHGVPSSRWIGFRPATRSYQPELRRMEDSALWLAYGHYRNGILLAPATAKLISEEIISSSGKGPAALGGTP